MKEISREEKIRKKRKNRKDHQHHNPYPPSVQWVLVVPDRAVGMCERRLLLLVEQTHNDHRVARTSLQDAANVAAGDN